MKGRWFDLVWLVFTLGNITAFFFHGNDPCAVDSKGAHWKNDDLEKPRGSGSSG